MKKLESFLHPELGNHNYGQITTDNFLLLSQIKRLKAWVKLQAERASGASRRPESYLQQAQRS